MGWDEVESPCAILHLTLVPTFSTQTLYDSTYFREHTIVCRYNIAQ